ncbi:hypothetical protein CGRA01v4_13763 [Colletotrichum graminicola]|nr:hypothetical protein CGRA01v4_13763 [Colletotrichum graminicola]
MLLKQNHSTAARLALADCPRNRRPLVHRPGSVSNPEWIEGRAHGRRGAFSFAAQPRCPEGQDPNKNTKTFGGHQDIFYRVILCPLIPFSCLLRRLPVPRKWSGSLVPVSLPPFPASEEPLDLPVACSFHIDSSVH